MHLWIILALLAPFLFASTNFIDKYFVSKWLGDKPVTSITILATVISLPFLVALGWFIRSSLPSFHAISIVAAVSTGLMLVASYYLYYKSLAIADTSLVATLFQLIVVFNYTLGLIFLNERLTLHQLLAAGIVVMGSILLALESREKRWHFRREVLVLMVASSLLISASDVLFKKVALDTAFWPTQFYQYAGEIAAGAAIFVFNGPARRGFISILRRYKGTAIRLGAGNEALYFGGIIAMRYAMLIAPIAVVQAVSSIQSIFLLLIGLALTWLFPHWIKEDVSRRHLVQKIAAILIMTLGTVMLSISTH